MRKIKGNNTFYLQKKGKYGKIDKIEKRDFYKKSPTWKKQKKKRVFLEETL